MSVVPHTDEFHYWKLRKWSSKYLTILGNCRQCDSNDLYWYGFVEILIYQWIHRIMCTLTWILVSWSLNKQITVARDCITRKTFWQINRFATKNLVHVTLYIISFLTPNFILYLISPRAAYMRQWIGIIAGSDNGLSPIRRQAIILTNAPWLLWIRPLMIYFRGILIKIHNFSFTKMHLKVSSVKGQSFCIGEDEVDRHGFDANLLSDIVTNGLFYCDFTRTQGDLVQVKSTADIHLNDIVSP